MLTTFQKQLADLYLEFFNDFLTVGRFAEYYGIPETLVDEIIKAGKDLHERRVEVYNDILARGDSQ
jgi:hypothetical protein